MRKYTFCLLALGLLMHVQGYGQASNDTTIYQVVQEMPRFPGCENLDTTVQAKAACADQRLLQYVYSQVRYPQEAREQGIQGTAVVSYVVEKDGSISQPQIVRDPGGSLGLAALEVILRIQGSPVRWIPGRQNGQAVRTRINLPIRFRLEEPLPYVLVGRDTVYTEYDSALAFIGGSAALEQFLNDHLDYPEVGNDSCVLGRIDIQIMVRPNNDVRILDLTDYNDMGFDFWYEAIDAATSTFGHWRPARYKGRPVSSALDLSLSFLPTAEGCKSRIDSYVRANDLAEEGARLITEDKVDEGLAKLTEAITAFPDDAKFLLLRGQAYLDNNQLAEACEDLRKARRIALVDWYDTVLPLICR